MTPLQRVISGMMLFGVEVTESAIVHDFERASRVLSDIRASGICVSLDDFGTGYSSLNYLKHLPLDTLKIDRSFLASATNCSRDATLVRTIVSIGHAFDMTVLAEGVETKTQLELLSGIGCDQAQGYYLGRPMRAAALEKMLAENRPFRPHPNRRCDVSPIRRRA